MENYLRFGRVFGDMAKTNKLTLIRFPLSWQPFIIPPPPPHLSFYFLITLIILPFYRRFPATLILIIHCYCDSQRLTRHSLSSESLPLTINMILSFIIVTINFFRFLLIPLLSHIIPRVSSHTSSQNTRHTPPFRAPWASHFILISFSRSSCCSFTYSASDPSFSHFLASLSSHVSHSSLNI